MNNTLNTLIQQDIEENLQKRGYGGPTFGSLDLKSDWTFLIAIAVILYFLFSGAPPLINGVDFEGRNH